MAELRVEQWKRKLLDLSLRNPLLNVRETSKFLPLTSGGDFGFEVPAEDGAVVPYKPALPPKEIKARLKEIYTVSHAMFEDSGVNSLFVAVGFLNWCEEGEDEFHRAPLILVPARLERSTGPAGFNLVRTEEDAVVNFCLLELLRSQFKIPIPDIEGGGFGDGDPEFANVFSVFSEAIRSRPTWSLSPDTALGIFAFDKIVIWKDLTSNFEEFKKNPFVAHLSERKGLYDDKISVFPPEEVGKHIDPARLCCPMSADASQLTAVLYSEIGKSFVLHGPPGTGKSQTITNIIAHNLALGKKVLFVSEKKAALDVVYKRLESVGLAPFCLELHSNKSKKANVMRQFQEALEMGHGRNPPNWAATCSDMGASLRNLGEYVCELHKPSWNGMSVYSCITHVVGKLKASSAALIPFSAASIKTESLDALGDKIEELAEEWKGVDVESFEALRPVKTLTWSPVDESRLRQTVEELLVSAGMVNNFKTWFAAELKAIKAIRYFALPLFRSPASWLPNLKNIRDHLDGLRLVMSYRVKAEKIRKLDVEVLSGAFSGKTVGVENARKAGFDPFVNALERGDFPPADAKRVYEESVAENALNNLIAEKPSLASFSGIRQEEMIQHFREIDEKYTDSVRKYIVAHLTKSLPDANTLDESAKKKLALLKHESAKKKRIMPIRQLLQETMPMAQAYKPCFLMSPLSVAQYLPSGTDVFDLVVFDEASQMTVWDAIGPISRGKQLIVVGDPKQLPPTAFFIKGDSVDDDPDVNAAAQDLESILDECLANGLHSAYLNWHYRSRHESLIAFSNRHYYEDRLNTFPAAESNDRLGVSFQFVDGALYDHKSHTNKGEAEALVEFLFKRLESKSERERSWGIVTFSVSQRKLIEDMIEERSEGVSWAAEFFDDSKPDGFFVKNLENVQGDERDVVIFSIGYAPDAEGNFAMMFGPINYPGGERRLNVAITRAREQVIVFSSTHSSAIKAERTNSVGVKHLKALMEYAETGHLEGDTPHDPDEHATGILGEVRDFIENHGYIVEERVGRSTMPIDLAVKDPAKPNRYALAIELDGPIYAAQRTVRDRDVLRGDVLTNLGWKYFRLWSVDWAFDRKRTEKRILEALPKIEVSNQKMLEDKA